jgi:hypothetical protein
MKQLLIAVCFCLLSCVPLSSQTSNTKAFEEQSLAVNVSQYGIKYPETFVLMQNRRGIRIEYVVERG